MTAVRRKGLSVRNRIASFTDGNVGYIFGEQLGKTSKLRNSDVLRGANFFKGKKCFRKKNMELHHLGGYSHAVVGM